jgi:hypothetical protein
MAKKLTYEFVKKKFKERGFTLLSTEYIGASVKLKYCCSEEPIRFICYNDLKQGHGCKICGDNKKKIPLKEVKGCFENRGYTLLSTEYKNCTVKLKYKCPKNHIGYITYNSFTTGRGCPVCSGKVKPTIEQVKKLFESRNFKLLSTVYVDSKEKLKYECAEGHTCYISYNSFQSGNGCLKCSGKEKHTLEQAAVLFLARGYKLLSNKYVNANTNLEYECPEGHFGKVSYGDFQRGVGCPICSGGLVSKISQAWLDTLNIPDLERECPITIKGKTYTVDGYDPLTNTVYEFLGDFWHGNPTRFIPENVNPKNKKSYGQLHKETFERFAILEAEGYRVVYIWEKDFKKGHGCKKLS